MSRQHVAQILVRNGMTWIDVERPLKKPGRLTRTRLRLQHDAQIDQRVDVPWRPLDYGLEPSTCVVELLARQRDHAEIEARFNMGRVKFQDLFQLLSRGREVARPRIGMREIQVTVGFPRCAA